MDQGYYTPAMAAKALGLKGGTLRTYHVRGGLNIDLQTLPNQHRVYTFRDLVCAAVMADLLRSGVPMRHAGEIVEDMRQYLLQPEFWLVVRRGLDEDDFYAIPGRERKAFDWRRPGVAYEGTNDAKRIASALAKIGAVGIVIAAHEIAAEVRLRLEAV